jgi:hypothetical protein
MIFLANIPEKNEINKLPLVQVPQFCTKDLKNDKKSLFLPKMPNRAYLSE